jgi:hypothetical protein
MTRPHSSPPWYAPWRSAAEPSAADDPADLGTAFGLDLSLDPMPRAADDAAAAPEDDARWVQRPDARRKTGR